MNAVEDLFDFSGRVALVTGGSRGIGRTITEAFLALGADAVVCGRNEPDEPPSAGGRTATFVTADVREPDDVARLVDEVVRRHGRLDVCVNNAGGAPYRPAAEASARFTTAVVSLNLIAPILVATAANAVMQTQDTGGSIVNIGSVSGLRPSPGTAAYGASKAGLVSLAQSLAVEWAPKVRVNTLSAGLILTEGGAEHYGGDDGVARVSSTVPLGRMGTADDIARGCVFLASSMSEYMTGENLVIHGGGEAPAFMAAARGVTPWGT